MPSDQIIFVIFQIAVLVMSAVIHEFAHGYAASKLGDQTAHYAGRLTLNPLKHIDPVGSIAFPLILVLLKSSFIFAWAKPVPYNPYNLRNRKWGELIVAVAGPLSNFGVAIFFAFITRFVAAYGFLPTSFLDIASIVVWINILLAVFNLMPVPPLDGSKILFSFLPLRLHYVRVFMERYSLLLLFIFLFVIWQAIFPLVAWLFTLLTGFAV